jgi:general secretion pathway protein J
MNTRARVNTRARGFTLLELLVAMFIAAIIFAMGYGAINQAVKNRTELQEQQAKLLELQTAIRVIVQDFVQSAPRPVRQPVGTEYYAALLASTTTQPFIQLTRAGWTNPAGVQRPGLQRVAYFLENGTLRRDYWTVLDPTQSSKTVRRDLLTHVKSVAVRFYSQGQTWGTEWPLNKQIQNDLESRPIAVEITIDTETWGKIVRIIELPG